MIKPVTIIVMGANDPITEQILKAALTLMNSKGFGALTISELARRSKITKQRLYYHYPSTDEVLIELAQRWSRTGQECALNALARTNEVGAMKVLAISEGMFDWVDKYNDLSKLSLVLYQSGSEVKKLNSFMEDARLLARERIKQFLVQETVFQKMASSKLNNVITSIHSLLYGFCLYVVASDDFKNVAAHRKNCSEALTRLIESYLD